MRRIALVGTASSGAQAPFSDSRWEVWGVSMRASYVTRADVWFELHRISGEPPDWAANWRKTMKAFTHDIPEVLMMYPEPDLAPKVTQYPYEHITRRFGTYFMTSTFAWMMAKALDELRPEGGEPVPGEIAVYGVDMEYGSEYKSQRVGFRHFFEVARIMGVPVTRLADSGLAYEPIPYPMWQDDPLLAKLTLRSKQTRDNLAKFEKSQHLITRMIAQDRALLAEFDAMAKPGYDPAVRRAALEKELAGLVETSAGLSKDIVYSQAADDEQRWMTDYLSP
jgi:hypothetical protein